MSSIRKRSSRRKQEIIEFINDFYLRSYRAPSAVEISIEFGCARSTIYRYLVEMAAEGLLDYDGKTISTSTIRKTNISTTIAPIVGEIACGSPNIAEENIEEFVALPTSLFGSGDFYILRTHGDSMIEAGIDEGDLVVIHRQETAQDGDIVAFMNEDYDTTLKRIYFKSNGTIILHPENSRLHDIVIRNPANCKILGVATKVMKDLD